MIADVDRDRRAPADARLAVGLPEQLAAALVETGEERARLLLFLGNEDAVAVQQRRTAGAVQGVQLAETVVPDLLAVEIDAQDAVVAERGVDPFAVGAGRA